MSELRNKVFLAIQGNTGCTSRCKTCNERTDAVLKTFKSFVREWRLSRKEILKEIKDAGRK